MDDAKSLCISNSNVSHIIIGRSCMHTRDSYKDVVFCTPKLIYLTIRGFLGYVSPSICNLPFLEGVDFDYGNWQEKKEDIYDRYLFNPLLESLVIDWLRLVANVKIIYISFRTLCQMHMFQKKYPTQSIVPCFVRLEFLVVRWISDSQIFDKTIRGKVKEMVTCLLQNSLDAKVDIILKSGSTRRKLED
ncbi:hypothetical protein P8452_35670 [Trifolium repens]|nr:hypothetical protein P8452_35670 [Trifolium repens]